MNARQINEGNGLWTLDVVLTGLAVMLLAGSMLLLSVAEPATTPDGAIEWHAESPLRAVVELLCLGYRMPTDSPAAVKGMVFGLGTGLALLVIGTAAIARGRAEMVEGPQQGPAPSSPTPPTPDPIGEKRQAHLAPLVAAQVLIVLYLLWSFASSRWSLAPTLALGGSALLTIHFLWAYCLGHGLSTPGAKLVAKTMVVVLVTTAGLAIWYHYGRNPTLRADFPVGNPGFLGACLIPGILLAGAQAAVHGDRVLRMGQRAAIPWFAVTMGALAVQLWALVLANSRGAYVGLAAGSLAMLFFWFRRRAKWILVALAVALAVAGTVYVSNAAEANSPTGRSATVRLRFYAWQYAWQMFNERPLTGYGQGGFVLVGDTHAINDVLDDPLVFESRITHAHNEWLEVMADLGSVGIVLLAAALLLTIRAAVGRLEVAYGIQQRWALAALLGSLVGLVVEECFSVGLRIPGVGAVFYTVLGLLWALSARGGSNLLPRLGATRVRQWATGVVACLAGVIVLALVREDFASGRDVYRAREALATGQYEDAADFAARATNRLSPQRALVNLYRLSEAHLRIAQELQRRALDRQRRAHETQPPDERLLALAQEDFRLSDEHCETGSAALKELIVRAPEFINHGRLRYWLNLTRARNAEARNDNVRQQALLADATAAIRRELRRQPFDPTIAVDFARLAGPSADPLELVEILARPLRYHRMTSQYMELLRKLASDPQTMQRLWEVIAQASMSVQPAPPGASAESLLQRWEPEVRRIGGAFYFLQGQYRRARDTILSAARQYDALGITPTIGVASCYGELAICQFFSAPEHPDAALQSAEKALSLAPPSRLGRELKHAVRQRQIEFLLAAGREDQARRLLSQTAPRGVTEADVWAELGQRYLRLCESLLDRRGAGGDSRQPPAELAVKMQDWARRAIDLAPDDPNAHYVAADLAFYLDDDAGAAEHLRDALQRGLPPDVAVEFLTLARRQRPESDALELLWQELNAERQPKQPTSPQMIEPSLDLPTHSPDPEITEQRSYDPNQPREER